MSEPSSRKMIGLLLSPGVKGLNLGAYYAACMAFIMMATFLPGSQPFLLNEFLDVPKNQQGVVSGNLNFAAEIVIILVIGVFGAMSDRVGRRVIMAFGFAVMSIAFYLYPQATTVTELLMYRLIYAVGIAAVTVMTVTIVADYVRDESRGKASGYLGVMNGLGAMVAAFILIKLPEKFVEGGMSPIDAGTRTYTIVAAIALTMAVIMWLGLKKKAPEDKGEERPGLVPMLIEGVSAGKDPGVALAYGASFVARGNLAVVGTFLTLWGQNYGTSQLGMTSEAALAQAGMVLGISYTGAFLGAPLFGLLTDRVSRTTALMITLGIAFVGYFGTIFVDNPLGGMMIVFAVIIGLSEVGCIITSGVLIAQQTPERIRGSAIGIFNLTGAIGILVASLVGGYLFDHWRQAGPFIFFGLVALAVLIWALLVRRKVRPPTRPQTDPAS